MVRKAVIPAAGLGTKFLPATKVIPKEMLSVVDRPTIQYIVNEAVQSGIEEVIFVVNKGKAAIIEHFEPSLVLEDKLESDNEKELLKVLRETNLSVKIKSVEQTVPRGLGDAILCAKELIGDEPFLVLLGDDLVDSAVPCSRQMIEVFKKHEKSICCLMRVEDEELDQYGICGGHKIEDRAYSLDTMVEKPTQSEAPSNLAIIGRYLLKPSIFKYLEDSKRTPEGLLQLTDAMSKMMKVEGFIGYEFEGDRYDAGDKFGLIQANIAFGLKRIDIRQRLKAYMKKMLEQV